MILRLGSPLPKRHGIQGGEKTKLQSMSDSSIEASVYSQNVPRGRKSDRYPSRSLTSRHVAFRLGLAFSLLVTLLIAVGDLGLRRTDRINSDLEEIMRRQWVKLQLSREAATYSSRNSRITMEIFLLKDRKEIDAQLVARAQNSEKIFALVAHLRNLCESEEEKRLLSMVEDRRQSYLNSYQRALRLLLEARKRDAAAAVMLRQSSPALLKYQVAWDDFVRFQRDQLELAARESAMHYASARRLALFTLVAAVLVAGAISFWVMRSTLGDVTAGLLAEKEALRTAHQEAEVFINAVPSILIGLDRDSRVTRWNSTAAAAFALSANEVLGKPLADCGLRWLQPDMRDQIRSWCSEWGSRRCDQVPFEKNGETRLLGLTITSVHMADGKSTELLVIGSDITDRKKGEDALLEAERKYRGIFDDAIVGIFQSTPGGRFLSVNAALARTFGYDSPQEMIATVTDISQLYVDPRRYNESVQVMDRLGSILSLECEVFRKDGSKIWISSSGRAVRQNRAVIRYEGMTEDITERKRAGESLNLLRMLMDQSHDVIEVIDPDTFRFLDFNQRACEDSGYSREGLLSRKVFDIDPVFNAAELNALKGRLQQSGSEVLETLHRRRDGSTYPVEVSVKNVQLDRAYWLCVVRDITDRQRLQQSQKLESIGQLAAGIAHEINTPTQYIGDNLRFLKDAFQELTRLLASYGPLLAAAKGDALSSETVEEIAAAVEHTDVDYLLEEIPKAVEQSLEGIDRVAKLVGAMKDFSHPGTKDKILLDLNRAIESTITVSRNEWKYVADMETDLDSSLPPISCLPPEFNQVILNLIVNAAHAIADVVGKGGSQKGKINVQTRNCHEWAEIRIQDTGSGIPESVRARIFDPFFTTKEIGKGTGQGLAIARSVVVDKHDGTIHFETEEGKGTTFIIRLPKASKAVAAHGASA